MKNRHNSQGKQHIENRQHKETIRHAAMMMAAKMEDERIQQSPQGLTCPQPSKCRVQPPKRHPLIGYGRNMAVSAIALAVVAGMVAISRYLHVAGQVVTP